MCSPSGPAPCLPGFSIPHAAFSPPVVLPIQNRPRSLAEIAAYTSDLSEFGRHVRDFLREWNRARKAERDLSRLLADEPSFLAGTMHNETCATRFSPRSARTSRNRWEPSRRIGWRARADISRNRGSR